MASGQMVEGDWGMFRGCRRHVLETDYMQNVSREGSTGLQATGKTEMLPTQAMSGGSMGLC